MFGAGVAQGEAAQQCAGGTCAIRVTPQQLLRTAEKLVLAHNFDAARPLVQALAQAPDMQMEANFLAGYIAVESADLPGAERYFRAVLRDRPDMTRARLELARVLMLEGKDSAADHHFRLAAEAGDLPPEIERTIRLNRGVLRDRRNWHINLDFGLAPDSNINNATDARSIDTTLTFGNSPVALDLSPDARRRSGIGETLAVSAGVRLRLSDGMAVLVDGDAQGVNYRGSKADDISALIAIGPEVTMKNDARVSVQLLGARRWYGGTVATRALGVRSNYQRNLAAGARLGLQIDIRHNDSGYGKDYSGWQGGVYATYERVVRKSMIASATVFARRDDLNSAAYSSTEVGANLGIGGELPRGINAGVSFGVSRAVFDGPITLLSLDPRHDWRFNGRAYIGARSLRLLGFSPSLTYTFNAIDSTIELYQMGRNRIEFGLARYF